MKTNKLMLSLLMLAPVVSVQAQDVYEDDIYYNPKKDTSVKSQKKTKQSNYIADFSSIDVDAYNMQGGLLPMPADTIGIRAENGEDFVYTQQIQKYYNPTIVLDNADLLADVLNNSYGNVDIVINDNGVIGFAPYSYAWPYYSYGWPYSPGWSWGASWGGWGWNVGLGYYDPWYAWGWGPSWGWPGSWYPGWGPGWTWGPAWGYPSYGHHYADYTPRGNRRSGASGGWASSTRPGGNYSANSGGHRMSGGRYGLPGNQTSFNMTGGNRRTYNTSNTISTTGNRRGSSFGNVMTTNNGGNRTYNSTTTTTTKRNYNTNNSTTNRRSYNSTTTNRSYNSGGSYRSGGNSGGSYRGGGGGRGRHR